MQGARDWSMVGKLRSYMLCGAAKKKKEKKKKKAKYMGRELLDRALR